MQKIYTPTLLLLFLLASASIFAQPAFTGFANSDFTNCGCFLAVNLADNVGDNGLVCNSNPSFPAVPPTGFDVQHVYMHYDASTDQLYVGLDMVGIGGDADGDGDPQNNSLCPDVDCSNCNKPFQAAEAIGVSIDADEDGLYEYYAGWALGFTQLLFYEYLTPSSNPIPRSVDMTLSTLVSIVPFNDPPTAAAPDPEFVLAGYSNIDPDISMSFKFFTNFPTGTADEGGQTNINLPVAFNFFEANYDGEQVSLDWQTAQELNNAGFEVEMAHKEQQYQSLGFVPGKGTTAEVSDYTFSVLDFQPGINYFRLRQIDLDGAYSYSRAVSVQISDTRLQVNPNVVSEELHLENQGLGLLNYQILNLNGQVMGRGSLSDGHHHLNVADYAPGIYLLKVTGKEGVEVKRFMKQ
jgi:hypothetical protein